MITTVWAATESLTTIQSMAIETILLVMKLALPGIVMLYSATIIIRLIAGSISAASALAMLASAGVMAFGLWLMPTLIQWIITGHVNAGDAHDPTTTTPPPPPPAPTSTVAPPTTAPVATEPAPPTDWTWLIQAAAVIAIVAVALGLAYLLWMGLSRLRAATAARRAQRQRWADSLAILDSTSTLLGEFECDIESVYFTRPLLADVNEPATAKFHAAYADALALRSDSAPTDDELITAFARAAAAAAYAFGLADENARRKGRIGVIHGNRQLNGDEKRKLDQARKLMAQAMDPATPSDNARQAQAKAREFLDQIGLVVPERLTAKAIQSIEALHKPALAAGAAASVQASAAV
ncbi:hypothetical protein [Mycobacterium hubeiense]|uniref:hypothetical protein n=1 Tax=Mycobacterium hubeiense TaxID=1867256 RepID=UPI00115A263C|nr:hypothetical protein [Mycobacterium sp. QGD 101]